MKILYSIFLAAFVVAAKAQDSLMVIPPLETLYTSIDSFYNQQLAAELKAFESNPKDYWMNFVPSVGIGYTPAGAPRPTLSYSLASLFNYRTQKRQVRSVRESIILKNRIDQQKTKLEAASILEQIKMKQEDLIFSLQIHEINVLLFEFYEKQNENNEIKPVDYLLKKKDFLQKEEAIRIQRRAIHLLIIELLKTSHLEF